MQLKFYSLPNSGRPPKGAMSLYVLGLKLAIGTNFFYDPKGSLANNINN